MLIGAKFIALDSSHWRQWLADALSSDTHAQNAAKLFYERLGNAGFTVLFCWHHLEELMAVEDEALAARRLAFIRNLPFLAWIGIVPDDDGLGAITDVMAAEVQAVLAGEEGLEAIRIHAKRRLLKFGRGDDVIVDHPAYLSLVQWHAQGRVQKDRSITAIAPFDFLQPEMRVHDLMTQRMRSADEMRVALERQHVALTNEIKNRGDKRITDAEQRSLEFIKGMLEVRQSLPNTVRELVLGGYALSGVDECDIGADTTIGEMDRLVTFRGQLRVIAEKIGRDFEAIKRRVSPDGLPHSVVRGAIELHGQSRERRPGSDLIDSYLLSLAPYCDLLTVDRRTAEDVRLATTKDPRLSHLLGGIAKASTYQDVLSQIGGG